MEGWVMMADNKFVPCIVETAWGETNPDARYSLETDTCFFQCDNGAWLNYEPQQVKHMFMTSTATIEDMARAILEMNGILEHWNEIALDVDGKRVNVELVVTFVDGVTYGRQYVSEKGMPKWKLWIKRTLNI